MRRSKALESTREDGRPSFQFYPNDWRREFDGSCVSLAAQGLWINMLCLMFNSPIRGKLLKNNGEPMSVTELAKKVGSGELECAALVDELEREKTLRRDEHGWIYNKKMVESKTTAESRSEAGRLGGRPSKGKATGKQDESKQADGAESGKQTGEEEEEVEGEGEGEGETAFDVFWKAYPCKVGPKAARKAWAKAKDRPPIAEIVAAIEKQSAWRRWRDGFVPNPATWLNQGRWADEEPPTGGGGSRTEGGRSGGHGPFKPSRDVSPETLDRQAGASG